MSRWCTLVVQLVIQQINIQSEVAEFGQTYLASICREFTVQRTVHNIKLYDIFTTDIECIQQIYNKYKSIIYRRNLTIKPQRLSNLLLF